jgi:hypothetical protein
MENVTQSLLESEVIEGESLKEWLSQVLVPEQQTLTV